MKFSQVDVIGHERRIIATRKEITGFWGNIFNMVLDPKNPNRLFNFYIPNYLFMRSVAFCDDMSDEINAAFKPNDLAEVLYSDFLEYAKKTNDLHDLHRRLLTRDLAPAIIKPYQTDKAYNGVIFEEARGFEIISAKIPHKDALRGEYLLRDMLEIYQEHTFTLENVLTIIYCDFVDDYRKGIIKNPIAKIKNYL